MGFRRRPLCRAVVSQRRLPRRWNPHNDHDGRDPEFIRAWSDIYSENYESISLEAIRDFDDTTRKPVPEEA